MKALFRSLIGNKFDSLIVFGLIIAAGITFWPLFHSGFTTNDDTLQQLLALRNDVGIFEAAERFAIGQGRFFFYYSGLLILLPYLYHAWWFTKGIALGMVLLNILLLGLFVYKLTRHKWLGYLVVSVFLATVQNTWEHNLLTAYPLVFTTSISFLLISALSALRATQFGSQKWSWFGAVSYFLGILTYEVFLLYLPLYLLILASNQNWRRHKFWRYVFPYLLVTGLYLGLYVGYRYFHIGGYDGNRLDGTSWNGFFKVIAQFGIASTPLYFYFHSFYRTFINIIHFTFEGDRRNPLFVFTHTQFTWWVKSVILVVIAYFGLSKMPVVPIKKVIFWFLAALAFVFIPVIPLGLTYKYQSWVTTGAASAFTVTYFSFFAMVMAVTFFMMLIQTIARKVAFAAVILTVGMVILLGSASILTDYFNAHISATQRQASLKWDAVDYWLGTEAYNDLPENSLIYAPSLWNYMNHPTYWSEYAETLSGKQLAIVNSSQPLENYFADTNNSATPAAYYLLYTQEPDEVQDYLLLAPITRFEYQGNRAKIISNEMTLFTRGLLKRFYIFIGFDSSDSLHQIEGEGMSILTDEAYAFVPINKQWPGGVWRQTVIRSKDMRIDQAILSHYVDVPLESNKRTEAIWQNGCYEREGTDEFNWHWCTQTGEVVLLNKFSYPRRVLLKAELASGYPDASSLIIDDGAGVEYLTLTNQSQDYSRELLLQPGSNRLTFKSDAQRYAPDDPRDIRFGVYNFSIDDVIKQQEN